MLTNQTSHGPLSGVEPKTGLTQIERVAFAMLWLFVFSIPGEKSLEIPGLGTISKLIGIVAIGCGLLAILGTNRIRVWNQAHYALVLFILWSGLSYMWSASPVMTGDRFLTYLQLFGMVCLIWQLARGDREQRALLQAYALGVCVSAIETVARYLLARQTYYQRYASEGFDPNDLALTCCLAIPMAYYLSLRSIGWQVWLYRFVIGLAAMTILLSASRAGTVAALVALTLVPLTFSYLSNSDKAMLVVAVGCLALLLGMFIPTTSWKRLATAGSELNNGTLNSRTLIWKAGFEAFARAPFQGIGAGAFPVVVEPILGAPKETRTVAHNTFFSILTETGVVGFGSFSAFLAILGYFIWHLPDLDRRFWCVLMATWAIGVSTLTWEQRKPTWLLFSLVIARHAYCKKRSTQAQVAQQYSGLACPPLERMEIA